MSEDMRRKIDMIKDELSKRGYDFTEQEIVKNGIKRYALVFNTGSNLRPTVYVDKLIIDAEDKNMLFEDIIHAIQNLVESNKKNDDFDPERILTKENLMQNTFIAAQKITDDGCLKKPGEFEGTEYVMRLRVEFYGKSASIKISNCIIENADVDEEELWQQALENTKKDPVIKSMSEIIKKRTEESAWLGADTDVWAEVKASKDLYIITNTIGWYGAATILNKDAIRDLAEKINVSRFAIIPCSVHECLLLPNPTEDMNINEIVKATNMEHVDPEEQLSDSVIFINFEDCI